MRSFVPLLCAMLLAGCAGAARPDSRVALAQSQYQPTVRAATDVMPNQPGPFELVAVALPLGPVVLKGSAIWDGTTYTVPAPSAQAQAAPCGPDPFAAPQAWSECDQADPSGRWIYVK